MFSIWNSKIKSKYSDIFISSLVRLDNNKVLIKYYINKQIDFNVYKGLFEFTYIDDDLSLFDKLPVGEWTSVELGYEGNILHILKPKKQINI